MGFRGKRFETVRRALIDCSRRGVIGDGQGTLSAISVTDILGKNARRAAITRLATNDQSLVTRQGVAVQGQWRRKYYGKIRCIRTARPPLRASLIRSDAAYPLRTGRSVSLSQLNAYSTPYSEDANATSNGRLLTAAGPSPGSPSCLFMFMCRKERARVTPACATAREWPAVALVMRRVLSGTAPAPFIHAAALRALPFLSAFTRTARAHK